MSSLTLIDDGTLDTVFECDVCGRELRYDSLSEYRDPDSGALEEEGFAYAQEDHADECGSEEEDAIIQCDGFRYHVSFGHEFLGTFNDSEDAERTVARAMDAAKLWPNVWFQDDHGGLTIYRL